MTLRFARDVVNADISEPAEPTAGADGNNHLRICKRLCPGKSSRRRSQNPLDRSDRRSCRGELEAASALR
jgi:hypothetical protein